jgi:hypothetical protein
MVDCPQVTDGTGGSAAGHAAALPRRGSRRSPTSALALFKHCSVGVMTAGHPSPKEAIPYSSAALRQDLERLRGTWGDCQANRDRDAIYGYLSAVCGLVAWWTAEGREVDRARRALRLQRLAVFEREDPFAAVIRCTADPAKAEKRTRSKWSRALRYAVAHKPDSEPLDQFIQRMGGINACAARFSRCLGRSPRRKEISCCPTSG